MKGIRSYLKNFTPAEWVFLALLVAQVLFTSYVNLFCNAKLNDYDSAGAYVHILEVYKSHSLFPSTYGYATTMDVDSTVWLAAVVLAIVKNIFVAQGICNILVILAYIFVLRDIFAAVGASRVSMLFTATMVLLPYSMGMVGYWNVMYVGVAANTVRNLIPLLYASILLELQRTEEGEPSGTTRRFGKIDISSVKWLVKAVACLLLMLVTSISAGAYVMLFGIASLILCDFFLYLRQGQAKALKSLRWGLHGMMAAMCVLGLWIQKRMGFASRASGQTVVSVLKFPDNISKWFTGIFEMFGALPAEDGVALFDAPGIAYGLKYVICLFFLVSFLYLSTKMIRADKAERHLLYVFGIGILDAIVLLFLDTTYGTVTYSYRYHIMPMLFVMIGGGFLADILLRSENCLWKNAMMAMMALLLAICIPVFDGMAMEVVEYSDAPEGIRASKMLSDIDDVMEENGIESAIIYSDLMGVEGRKLCAYGDTTDYLLYPPSAGPLYEWGGSTRVRDKGGATGRTALITTVAEFETLQDSLQGAASLLGQVGELYIYEISEGSFELP